MSRTPAASPALTHVDVMIVGAGLTGIDLGYHVKTKQPDKTFAIIDGRDAIGGTWDLFRYPGLRSDADMQAFGFGFKPWTKDNSIADAHEILDYLNEAIAENDLARHIHLGHKVLGADFSSAEARWTVSVERTSDGKRFDVTCGVLLSAAGYYDYAGGYTPHFEGREDFHGPIVHPQQWPEDLDYTGKKVVVIGSGATAVTLLPAMADKAGHVTMLQRSPSYVLPAPRRDPIANALLRLLPETLGWRTAQRFSINRQKLIYGFSRRFPTLTRRLIRKVNAGALPEGYAVDTHFNPKYQPWDQRLCVVPDSDMFKAISSGAASVVTDRIVRFTERGILLESGSELEADVIVTATGLKMLPFGGIALQVDGRPVDLTDRLMYKSMMVSGVPNFAFVIGYTNNAWTLKVDLVADHVCRLLAHMDRHGYATVTPVTDDPSLIRRPFLDMDTGYVNRGAHLFPKQGSHGPWTVDQSYTKDRARLRTVEDAALKFTAAVVNTTAPPRKAAA
ncbi:NAD(P)/FAD-dependent oxidoreductase [Streptomyces sp. SID13726]|uniref:flavin-containing monooxygenase n=1 Tax=Streptomyces sp. SID13726 TaxID=2706058 RepID=UPI0013B7EB54|nr:NAD(P)/FAD-dependent oxidoreductase [Streptomyces sp. SID13726]NEB04167.1 NAD(P)/FAD-dependent oxidoreductase [Streptomyces sp. SID13726]